jgi:ABC-type uncharacterized transport system substrate-binding protein
MIVGGKAITEVPAMTARQVKLTVNVKAAQRLGIEVPKSFLGKADRLIQ